MNLNSRAVLTLCRSELRMIFRDRRMLFTSILLPLLVTPLMFLGSQWGIKRHTRKLETMTYTFAVEGTNQTELRALASATIELLQAERLTNSSALKLRQVDCANASGALEKGDIQFFLELSRTASTKTAEVDKRPDTKTKAGPDSEENEDFAEKAIAGAPVVRIVYRGDRHESAAGMTKIRLALEDSRRVERGKLLKDRQFPIRPGQLFAVSSHDVAEKSQVAGLALGRMLSALLLLFIFSSGAVVATDSLAGEKERGTLETLLTTAVGRLEILAAKHLAIVVMALLITTVQILNLLFYIRFRLVPVPENLSAALTPATALLLIWLYLPLTALAASLLLLVSGYARTYKEAQMWFLPLILVGLALALAPLLPGIPLRSVAVLVPIANIALAAKEILVGSYDWPMIVVAWSVTTLSAALLAQAGARALVQEKLITASEGDDVEFAGGPRLFERHVVRWYAVLWGALLLISNYTQKLDLRLQLFINLAGLFFCACCLMIWKYRLDWREAFAMRLPKPAVWLGLVPAIPGGFITALAFYQLGNLVMPTPTKVSESFTEAVIPPGISFVQLVLILSLLPGFFEELTFRGLLLYGLRRQLSPPLLAVVVGLVFGIFHVALFRLVPTAVLGISFAAVTLLTGSIFPAMLWHACNNAFGVMAAKFGFPENELDFACYAAGVGLFVVAFWIFWRSRTVYPGLRRVLKGH